MGGGHQDAVDLLIDFAVQAELVLGALHRCVVTASLCISFETCTTG